MNDPLSTSTLAKSDTVDSGQQTTPSSTANQHARESSPTGRHPNSTSSHPPASSVDPTISSSQNNSNSNSGGQFLPVQEQDGSSSRKLTTPTSSSAAELSSLTLSLRSALRQFPDFPSPGILFEDIMPIFANPQLHESLIRALEIHVLQAYGADNKPDVLIGLEARGFLFGPSLALRLGAGFVPVRKQGKLPGPTETASYKKEYGEDFFQMQADAVKPGQKVLILDDIIATGGSAAAAGSLVKKLGGSLLGYVFIMELDFLKGRHKLDAPVFTLLSSQ